MKKQTKQGVMLLNVNDLQIIKQIVAASTIKGSDAMTIVNLMIKLDQEIKEANENTKNVKEPKDTTKV